MTCPACEHRLERRLGALPGVAAVHASASRGKIDIAWRATPDTAAVEATVRAAGYDLGRPGWLNRSPKAWATVGLAAVVVVALGQLAGRTGLTSLSSHVGDLQKGGLIVVLLLGLAAGVSSCMALSGGLILALAASNEARLARLDRVPGRAQRLRPHLAFNAGRVVGFTALGAVLGAVGGTFVMPTWLVAGLMLLAALVLGLVGLRLTEVSPRLAGWTLHLPAGWSRRLRLDEKAHRGYSDGRAALLGVATFFLPCGFTQAAAVFALSTGSPFYAAAVMGTFALGTAPGLFTLGGLPSLLTGGARTTVLRALGVLVIAFALVNGAGGLRVLGIDPLHPFSRGAVAGATTVTDNVEVSADLQILHTQQFTDGYFPVHSVVYAGLPIRWVVEAGDPQSCSSSLRAPSLGVAATLTLGPNVFELPAQEPGFIRFSCSMGMTGGDITVIPLPSATPESP